MKVKGIFCNIKWISLCDANGDPFLFESLNAARNWVGLRESTRTVRVYE